MLVCESLEIGEDMVMLCGRYLLLSKENDGLQGEYL